MGETGQAGSEGLGLSRKNRRDSGDSTKGSLSLWPITFLVTNYIYLLNQSNFLLRPREKRRMGKSKGKE